MTPFGRVARAGLVLAAALVLAFGVAAPPERCPTVRPAELRASAQSTVDWFARNQHPDGTWLYLYDKDTDSSAPEYNVVRHSGAVEGLYQAHAAGLQRSLRPADRGTRWALDRLAYGDGWIAVDSGEPRLETGATALLVAGLLIRREDTGDTRYDRALRRLGRFLVAQIEPSGAVLAYYDDARGRPVAGEYSKYYTGEAYWALALLHRAFPGEDWGRASNRVGAYLATKRDDLEHHRWPIEDHWAAYGLSETVEFAERGRPPLTEDELSYVRSQAELFGVETRWIAQRLGPWGAIVRGQHVPRGGGYGVMGEGLTGLWRTAVADPRLADIRAPIAERATCIAGLAIDAQSDAREAASAPQPSRVEGAWFRDGETRMDDQQHALAGLLRTVAIVRAEQGRSGAGRTAPSGPDEETPSALIWGLVLLLALNPVRAGFGLPREGSSPRAAAEREGSSPRAAAEREGSSSRAFVEVAVVGGAVGAAAVCAAAILGDPLLDALDVSDPSFRVGAGVIAVVAGLADLLRRPPAPEPALPGRRAALIPVAIPFVARPALLVLALGAGADRGALVALAAMAAGVATLAALAAARPMDDPPARAMRWAARVLALGLIGAGVTVTIDGVFDV